MGLQHHGDNARNDAELRRLFSEQTANIAKRQWPEGRISGDDDGELACMIATDDLHRKILIRFPKPVDWIGLDVASAEYLRNELTERLLALKVGLTI